jgi:pimeloyl-ACP methyl ester carboxylesterase
MPRSLSTRIAGALAIAVASLPTFALDYSGRQHNKATFETLAQARVSGPVAVAKLEGNTGITFVSHPVLDGYPSGNTWIYRAANLYGGRAAARLNTNIMVFAERAFASPDAALQYLKDLGLVRIVDEAIGSVVLVTPADGKAFGAGDQKHYYALQTAMLAQKAGDGVRNGARYADAEYFGGFGYTYVIGIDGGASFLNDYVAGTLDYVSRIAGMLLVNGQMQDVRQVAGLVPVYLVNALDQVVAKYKAANQCDAYARVGEVESFFSQQLPLKKVIVVRSASPDLPSIIRDAYYNLFTHAMRVPVGRPGLHSASTPYQGYSMDQAPLSLSERNAVFNLATRDGIKVFERKDDRFRKFSAPNGEYLQTWFDYLPAEVVDGTAARGSVPLVLALHGGGDDPRQFVEEIGLLPLAGSERFAIVAPEHQSSLPTANASLPALVEYTLRRWPALDPTRVYVTGYSLGGAATLRAINGRPSVFAAAVPMAAAPYVGTPEEVKQFDKVDLPVMFTTSEFDLAGAFDQAKGQIAANYQAQLNLFLGFNGMPAVNYDFVRYPVNGFAANGMDRIRRNGEYESYRWYIDNAAGVPMVGLSYTKGLMHALYPEYGKIAWEFFRHYARDPATGAISYRP